MFELKEKICLITGSSGGIGGAIAKAFHAQGAKVVLSGTRQESLENLAQELGTRVYVVPCNLKDIAETEQLIPQVEALAGPLDVLVNNAGITRDGLIMRLKDEDWAEVINTNLSASFRLCRASIRGMIKRRWGRVINISSIVGVMGNPGQVNYCASKAGMIGMSKALALEVATRGVTVNSIAPGFIESSMTEGLSSEQKARILEAIPQGRIGNVTEIAAAAVYLASQEAAYITGQTLHINGGMLMV